MLQTIQLQGTDSKLYQLVAPFVMNPRVLRKNNNYPFKTTEDFIWFVALDSQQVVGFLPVEIKNSCAVINNYYVYEEEEKEILSLLLSDAIQALGSERTLLSVTLTEHQAVFENYDFMVDKEWKRYIKMRRE